MMEAAPLSAGNVVAARYEVIRRLGVGGMGAVYEVLDRQTNRRRALKLMLPVALEDADLNARFRQEATVAGRVESDHIVEVFDTGTDEQSGAPFLVMELLRGTDLAYELKQTGRFSAALAVDYLAQLAMGLDKVHAEGIVHRDLKLENIFVSRRDDGSALLKILDFGIAKVVAVTGSVRTTRALGTPLFMAPEQLRGDGAIDARADLYSLAHLAYTLLVGSPYWQPEYEQSRSVYRFIMKVVDGPVESAGDRATTQGTKLPRAFDPWFARAAATDPEDRFGSAAEQIAALAEVLGVEHAVASPHESTWRLDPVPAAAASRTTAAVSRVASKSGRGGRRTAWGLAALAITVVVLAVALWPRPRAVTTMATALSVQAPEVPKPSAASSVASRPPPMPRRGPAGPEAGAATTGQSATKPSGPTRKAPTRRRAPRAAPRAQPPEPAPSPSGSATYDPLNEL